MIDPENVPEVHGDEMLARFILNKKHFRPSDNAVKPVLFLAYKHFPSAKEDQLSFAAKLAAAASDRIELPAELE